MSNNLIHFGLNRYFVMVIIPVLKFLSLALLFSFVVVFVFHVNLIVYICILFFVFPILLYVVLDENERSIAIDYLKMKLYS